MGKSRAKFKGQPKVDSEGNRIPPKHPRSTKQLRKPRKVKRSRLIVETPGPEPKYDAEWERNRIARRTNGRWRLGQSGNPGGIPKGASKSLTTILKEVLMEYADGRRRKTTKAEALIRSAFDNALKGDFKFFKEIYERIEGKVPDRVAVASNPMDKLTDDDLLAIIAGNLTNGQSAASSLEETTDGENNSGDDVPSSDERSSNERTPEEKESPDEDAEYVPDEEEA